MLSAVVCFEEKRANRNRGSKKCDWSNKKEIGQIARQMSDDEQHDEPMGGVSASRDGHSTGTTPWVEKYRPNTIGQVAHQDQVVQTLQSALATGNVSLPCQVLLARCLAAAASVAIAAQLSW